MKLDREITKQRESRKIKRQADECLSLYSYNDVGIFIITSLILIVVGAFLPNYSSLPSFANSDIAK